MGDVIPFPSPARPEPEPGGQVIEGDVCSSAMPQRDAERKIAFIPLGSLDDDPSIKPADHIFVAYKAGWHDITDDLPRFGEAPPG